MKNVTTHHDGHGLNESLVIAADEPSNGNASHLYRVFIGEQSKEVATIQFQQGPRDHEDSTPGITEAVLLAILADRMQGFNSGPFSCRENSLVLTKVQEALHWIRHRADERAKRGVLGQEIK